MNVGDVLHIKPNFYSTYGMVERDALRRCVVVYIHPEGRFYVVEFRSELGIPWRETFYPWTRRIRDRDYRDVSSPDLDR